MDVAELPKVFEQLANKAKRAGLLRYHNHGVIIITLPAPSPSSGPDQAKPPTPVATTPPAATLPPAA